MTIKCLIVCANELFGVAVENLCKTQSDLKVVNLTPLSNNGLAQELERYHPNVLILDEGIDLNSPTGLYSFLESFPELRVIKLNTQVNLLQVYKKQDVLVTKTSDLLSVVRNQAY